MPNKNRKYRMDIVECDRSVGAGLRVTELGHSSPPAGLCCHRCDPEYTLHFIASGRGFFNGIPVDATKGFLIAASEPYEYRLDDADPWEHYWFRFEGYSAAELLTSLGIKPESRVFDSVCLDGLRPEFDRVLSGELDSVDISTYLLGLFYKTLSYLAATYPQTVETRSDAYLRLATQFAEHSYAEPITVEDMAMAASISSKYLYKLFTERRGESPKAYLTALRLERARTLLERTDLAVSEIARSVGYEHANYFAASFRRVYGSSPAEYRRKFNVTKETEMTETRLALARAIYENYYGKPVSQGRLAELIERVHIRLGELNKIDEFPDLPWNHEYRRELWFAALCGAYDGFPDGRLEPERELTDSEKIATLELLAPNVDKLFEIINRAESRLAKASALYLFKSACRALYSEDCDGMVKAYLCMMIDVVRRKRRDLGEITTVTGSPDFERDYIYKSERGPYVREVRIKSKKPLLPPLEIVQLTDLHYNCCNAADLAEANPALMSTLEHRKWLANGASVEPVRRALDFADLSDLTVVTGDILDYLSYGASELTVKELFDRDVTLLACIGGHDITRKMQGRVADGSSLESRYDCLRRFWPHELRYESRIVGGTVMAILLDNSLGGYDENQLASLGRDLARARAEELTVLIFQHEQLSTANPADTDVPVIRVGDTSSSRDFSPSGGFIGSENNCGGATKAVCELIRSSGDVIGGIFCGHHHNDMYTEILTADGGIIPQYILTACPYDGAGHVIRITVE